MSRNPLHWAITRGAGLVVAAVGLFLVVGCSSGSAVPANVGNVPDSSEPVKAIVWAKVDSEPTEAIGTWQPVVDYIAANLDYPGDWTGKVKIAEDSDTMVQLVESGEVDLVIDSLYPAMIVAEASGAEPLVQGNSIKPAKHAVIFTKSDSGVTALDDLNGHVMALAERHSTSGFMLPVAYMKGMGMNLSEAPAEDAQVGPEEVGYVIAGDDDVTVLWVLNGTVVAGAVDNGTFDDFSESNPGDLVSIAETDTIARAPILLVRSDMDHALQDSVRKVLTEMHQDPQGQAILKDLKMSSFAQVDSDVESAWGQTKMMYDLIRD